RATPRASSRRRPGSRRTSSSCCSPSASRGRTCRPVVEPVSKNGELDVAPTTELGPDPVGTLECSTMSTRTVPLPVRARLDPRSAGRFALQCMVDEETRELLRHVQSLLGHAVLPGDVAEVLKRSLRVMARALEKQKFGKCTRPGKRRGSKNPRYIPLEVKRAV